MNLSIIAFILLTVSIIVQIVFLFKKKQKPDPFSHILVLIASLLLLATTIIRSIEINFVAITGTFEALVFFAGIIGILLFIYRIKQKEKYFKLVLFWGTVVAFLLLALASSPLVSAEVKPPIPALQSHWLVIHVVLSFIGESFFAIGFVSAICYLIFKDEDMKKNVDRITYTSIAIGYPIFIAGALIFGAIWAKKAWGSYWSWDPKETWALITGITYTVYLHMRFIKKMRGKASAILSIVGFVFTIFTFLGVNYLLPGLHSYL
ncbi:unnamed protein product [marine sediment metagenome]|uniref:Cytochrome c assembly protein domain-containing protein n=1 Tax=marine sediment metagenome TaxID=412755 RepID=X1FL54_9ZZZZ